tara:strand:+ start:3480 stop:3998 length:519 start_codon:yes stop_codon:yes gene_type:complete
MSELNPRSRDELEKILLPFDEIGSYTDFTTPAGTKLQLILDHLYIVRAAPDLNSAGEPQGLSWWLGWFPVDWTSGDLVSRPHVTKIVRMSRVDDYWLRLRGSNQELMDLYWFLPEDHRARDTYDEWQKGAARRAAAMAASKEEQAHIADTWPDPIDLSPIDLTESQKKRWQF